MVSAGITRELRHIRTHSDFDIRISLDFLLRGRLDAKCEAWARIAILTPLLVFRWLATILRHAFHDGLCVFSNEFLVGLRFLHS